MDPQRIKEVTVMSKRLEPQKYKAKGRLTELPKRYLKPEVVEYIANQYVLGLLTTRAHQRVEKMLQYHAVLEHKILGLQARFIGLDQQTPELVPNDTSWQAIADQLQFDSAVKPSTTQAIHDQQAVILHPEPVQKNEKKLLDNISFYISMWFSASSARYATAFSIVLFSLFMVLPNPFNAKNDQLSYVAVLTQEDGAAHIVASTYGESKKFIVNVINKPKVSSEQSLELWVVSKTDFEARSLGLISSTQPLIEQKLTEVQWRLIKDSQSLMVTVEEFGGSPIGEPSDIVVSRGLCVQLQEWTNNA